MPLNCNILYSTSAICKTMGDFFALKLLALLSTAHDSDLNYCGKLEKGIAILIITSSIKQVL